MAPCRDTPLMSTPTFAPEGKNRAFGFFDKGTPDDFERIVSSMVGRCRLTPGWKLGSQLTPRFTSTLNTKI